MSLPVRLRRLAQAEYDRAADRYEGLCRGLGDRFVTAIQRMFARIADQPNRWPEALDDVREAPVPRWPFCIYYQVHADHVMALAVFHTSRDPAVWQSRA